MARRPSRPSQVPVDPQTAMELRRNVDRRLVALRTERLSWWQHWCDLSDHILPRRGRFLTTPNQPQGWERNGRIIDSTGTLAARTLASGMMAGITSPARPWFRLTVADPDLAQSQDVKLWLDDVTRRMARVFAKSNFYNSLAVLYEELSVFGTGVMIILEDREDVIRCQTLTVGEYFLANSERQQVNTLYREFPLTVGQVVAQFGEEACSPTVLSLHRSGQLDREVMIGHAIEPNSDMVEGNPFERGMPWRSVYWEIGSGQTMVLASRGFREFPVCAPRWHLTGNDVYGRSPGMDALGDVKALQVEQRRKAQAIEKMVNPPMVADVSLKNQPATLLPGGVTYLPGNAAGVGFKPVYEVTPPLEGLVEDIREVQKRVNQAFYADLWMMISEMEGVQPRNEMEIAERRGEKLLQLGPMLERFQSEMLGPAIERVFAVMSRAGLLPPAPVGLAGGHLDVQYISALASAQKAVATTAIEGLASFVGSLASVQPQVADKVDFDEAVEEYGDALGVNPKILVPEDKVAAVREQRAQQQAQQQAAQNAMAAVQGAQTLSQTDVGQGQNALQKMLGGGL